MLAKKAIRLEYMEENAVTIQRFVRKWLRWRHGMYLVKRMVVRMQSLFRAWGPKRDVEMLRRILGPHVKRLPSQLVALVRDKQGKLTRYRAFRSKERVCPHVARIVRLKALPPEFREDLAYIAGYLQAFLKHRLFMKKVVKSQKVARGWLVRRRMRCRREAAQAIQRTVRSKLLRSRDDGGVVNLHDMRANIILVQAYSRGFLERVKNKEWREEHKKRFGNKQIEEAQQQDEALAADAAETVKELLDRPTHTQENLEEEDVKDLAADAKATP